MKPRVIIQSAVFILASVGAISCRDDQPSLERLYSREIRVEDVKREEIPDFTKRLADRAGLRTLDIIEGLDGDNAFFLANKDVEVVVESSFGESCSEEGCPWIILIAARDPTLPVKKQQQLVDNAFQEIRSYPFLEHKIRD